MLDQSSPCCKEARYVAFFSINWKCFQSKWEQGLSVLCCRMKAKSVLQVIGLLQGKCVHFRKPSVGLETTIALWEHVFRKICYYISLCLEDSWMYLILSIFSKCKYNLSTCISLFFFPFTWFVLEPGFPERPHGRSNSMAIPMIQSLKYSVAVIAGEPTFMAQVTCF